MQPTRNDIPVPMIRWPIRALAIAACAATITLENAERPAFAGPHRTHRSSGKTRTRPRSPQPHRTSRNKDTGPTRKGGTTKKLDKCGRKREPLVLSGRLNLNATTERQLSLLPGVGPAKARRIIRWRARHRRFRRVRDLRRVRGFGYKTVRRLARYLSVKGESSLAWRTIDAAKALHSARKLHQKRPTRPTR